VLRCKSHEALQEGTRDLAKPFHLRAVEPTAGLVIQLLQPQLLQREGDSVFLRDIHCHNPQQQAATACSNLRVPPQSKPPQLLRCSCSYSDRAGKVRTSRCIRSFALLSLLALHVSLELEDGLACAVAHWLAQCSTVACGSQRFN
jgi:hypothetical protein